MTSSSSLLPIMMIICWESSQLMTSLTLLMMKLPAIIQDLPGSMVEEINENPVKATSRRLPWLITLLF